MIKTLTMLMLCLFTLNAYSVHCFVTGVKANCWESYNVTIDIVDTKNNEKMASIIIPAGSLWSRQEFECTPGENLRFDATFNPIIWEKEKDKVYTGLRFWKLPVTAPKEGEVWNLNICFPTHFSQVPLPPEAQQRCVCDMQNIDPIEL